MLIKLIRYNLYSCKNRYFTILPVMGGLLLLSFIMRLFQSYIIDNIMQTISIVATVVAIIVCALMIVTDTYSKFCGRESTLLYSIPTTTHHILLAQLLCSLIWIVYTLISLFVFWVIWFFLILPAQFQEAVWNQLNTLLSDPAFLKGILMSGIAIINYLCLLFLCAVIINIPAFQYRNMGMASGIAAWVIIGQGSGLLYVGIWAVSLITSGGTFSNEFLNDPANTDFVLNSLFPMMTLGMGITSVVFYTLSSLFLSKRRSI